MEPQTIHNVIQSIPFSLTQRQDIQTILQYWDVDDGTFRIENDHIHHSWTMPSKRHEFALVSIKQYLNQGYLSNPNDVKGNVKAEPPAEPNIAEEACRLVLGDRNESYGDPKDDYDGTAKVWSGLLIGKLKPGVEITAREAIIMMAALKLRREVTRPKRDNRVDAIGYGLCLDWVQTGIKPKPLSETK